MLNRPIRKLIVLPVLCALLLLAPHALAQGVNARNLIKLARSAADSGDWDKARDYATQALQEEGGYLDAYYLRAFAYRQLGEKKKAEDDFREVIRRDPKFLGTYGALADMYMADKEWDKAEKILGDLGIQDEGAKWASYYRGVMAYDRGDLARAEKMWKDALAKDVNFARASHNLGVLALGRQELARALTYFSDALQGDENNAMYRFHLAWVQEKMGQIAKAQENCKKLQSESGDSGSYWLLARALDKLSRRQFDSALKTADNVLKSDAESVDGLILKARSLIGLGRLAEAREVLKAAQSVDANFSEIEELLKKLSGTKAQAEEEQSQ